MRKNFLIVGSFFLFPIISFSGSIDFQKMKESEEKKVSQKSFDEFDSWVDDAIRRNVLKEKIEFKEPSKFESVLRKISPPFIRLYICSVHKCRAFKNWVAAVWKGRINWKIYAWIFRKSNSEKTEDTAIEK